MRICCLHSCVILGVCDSVRRLYFLRFNCCTRRGPVCVCVCKSGIMLYLSVIERECVTKVLINPIIRTRTSHLHGAYHPTRDNMFRYQPTTFIKTKAS
jgi:hypothetical protein